MKKVGKGAKQIMKTVRTSTCEKMRKKLEKQWKCVNKYEI